jgi:DNA-binding LytR/AlgR family response regulator
VKIRYDEILFAEALQNYVSIQTTTKKYITYLTFKSLVESLPAHLFLQTHKSFVASLPRIDSVEGNELIIGVYRIPISRTQREEVLAKVLGDRYLKR